MAEQVIPTAAQMAKLAGFNSLAQVSTLTGVSAQTLTNWRRERLKLFKVVLRGCGDCIDG